MAISTFLEFNPLRWNQSFRHVQSHNSQNPLLIRQQRRWNLNHRTQVSARFTVKCSLSKNQLTVSYPGSRSDAFEIQKQKKPLDKIAGPVVKALESLKKPAVAAILLVLFLFCYSNLALAASGGRMGGNAFSSRSGSSSPYSSRSYTARQTPGSSFSYSAAYYGPSPLGGGIYVGPAVGVGAGSSLFLIMMGFAVFVLVSGFLSDRSESSVLTASEKTSVLKLQTTLALLRHPDYCISSYSSVDVKRSTQDGEKRFNQLSIEERGKFDEETLVNVDNIKRQSSTRQRASSFSNEYIVITILVAAEGVHKFPTINGSEDLKEALQKLGSIPKSKILAVEVLWTPQNEDGMLSERELLVDYPLLRPL